jgi:NTP pyrophosphatase (non-canonical NTP hydrolase)
MENVELTTKEAAIDGNNMLCSGLNQSANIIYQNNKEKGFWDKERNVGEMLMLIVSELGEAMEAHRKGKFSESFDRFNWFNDWDKKEKSSDRFNFSAYMKDSFEDEIADTIIRLLDLSAGLGIDIEKHINFKIMYNKTRDKLHGKLY